MKIFSGIVIQVLLGISMTGLYAQSEKVVLPSPEQVEWAKTEIGVLIHWDLNVFAPDTYKYGDKATLPPLSIFNPSKPDTDQWIKVAKAAGANYAVLVAKHGTGFALWPSKANNYHVGNTPWKNGKGDIVADFIRSCKKYGLKPGIYYSVNSSTLNETSNNTTGEQRRAYNAIVLEQLTELWTQYGRLFEIWFDGGILPDNQGGVSDQIAAMIKKYQPRAILFQGPPSAKNLIRWVGNESGVAPYPNWSRADTTTKSNGTVEIKNMNGNPDGKIWCPAESDFPSRLHSAWEGGWFWRANREQDVLPLENLIDKYYATVGRNSTMLVGMAIDTSGLFPEKETKLFIDFGKEIKKRFGHSIAESKGTGNELVLNLGKQPVKVNHVVIMENISKGEHIRKYAIEGLVDNTWVALCDGISVGHKRIQTFKTAEATKLRIKVVQHSGAIDISKFAAYYAPVEGTK